MWNVNVRENPRWILLPEVLAFYAQGAFDLRGIFKEQTPATLYLPCEVVQAWRSVPL